ncbi:hypothetical protein WHR41_00093 [Cladosporium halotolerans]|uniref:BTB domain-containing protein n=1 Tax=Cladosporium halotolerans TaxID=1052096 RepID=A0AB34L155_9PEZI
MFSSSRSRSHRESFGYRAGKATSNKKQRSFKDLNRTSRIVAQASTQGSPSSQRSQYGPASPPLNSAIVTICVGQAQRLFAAHEDVLSKSPYFAQACREQFFETANKRIELTYEEPEVFSAVLEYLYKGDYTPQIGYDKKRTSFYLATNESRKSTSEVTIQHSGYDVPILKDTAIYCAALRFSLPHLQALALKKQGLQSGVQTSVILASARFAYSHTPASDSSLRAHYLALIIRSRATFKRSGTMQAEMMAGGSPLWFDLFVAMVEHLDDVAASKAKR